MATSQSYKTFLSLILLALFLLADSCSATMRLREGTDILKRKINERKMKGFVYRGLAFNFFPKGFPIPPSGPSKRHNSKGMDERFWGLESLKDQVQILKGV